MREEDADKIVDYVMDHTWARRLFFISLFISVVVYTYCLLSVIYIIITGG